MSNQIGKIERKSRFSFGTFFFGTIIGFILTLASIVGVCCFAYFKVSPKWVKDTFKVDIDLGSDDLNSLTLSKLVNNAIYLGQNIDSYTLDDLKNDFGIDIGDDIVGIDITDLKQVPFDDLLDSVSDKFKNISAEELKSIISSSESLDNIMDKTILYYINSEDSTLYEVFEAGEYSKPAQFKYEIKNNKVYIKNFDAIDINFDNTVSIKLKYLPLTKAIDGFVSNLGDNITIGELRSEYGVELPSYFAGVDDNVTINELEGEINKLYLADFLGYQIRDGAVYNSDVKVVGVMETIAKMKIGELKNAKQTIDNMRIAEILGYTYNQTQNKVFDENGVEVKGILGAISRFTIANITDEETGIDSLTVADIFTEDDLSTGVLSLIESPSTTPVTTLPSTIQTIIQNATIEKLIQKQVISASNYNETIGEKYIIVGTGAKQVKDCTISELINSYFTILGSAT